MLYVHVYQYTVIVKHVFLYTKISAIQYCGRYWPAKHRVLKQLKEV